MKNVIKHPVDMSAAELAEATKQFDRPYAFEKTRLMTSPERAQERVLRRGRAKIGQVARKVSVSLESGVLKQTDTLAKKKGMKRSELIASFVMAGLRRAG